MTYLRNLFSTTERRAGRVLGAVVVVTIALVVPFLAMAPTESASTEPTGPVFTARDRVDDTFVSSVRGAFFVAESTTGDVLLAEPLNELLTANDALRRDADIGPTLFTYFDVDADLDAVGVLSLAELVDAELESEGGSLAAATDDDVKRVGADLIDRFGLGSDVLGLSSLSTQSNDGDWIVPAVTLTVLSDDTVLGFGNTSVNLGGGTEVEEYDRELQTVLRTAENFQVNGVAIDVNLTSQEQGAIAGPFIGFTILAVLLIVGFTFRSYWVMATVSVALTFLIVWLKGISNLIGLEDDLVLSLIVPIAMVSFGVDFAFHAVGRYREERADGRHARAAFGTGMVAVSSALLLALVTGVVAFLANATSGIESIVQFGIGAAIALVSAYLLLGIVTPLVVARIEASVPAPKSGRRATSLRAAGGVGVASLTMASVLFLVFISPVVGVVLTLVTALAGLVVPAVIQRRKLGSDLPVGNTPTDEAASSLAAPLGRIMERLTARRWVVLPFAIVLTGVAGTVAAQVPAEFDVNDFFSADADFVVGLDQVDKHVGDRGGEPAILYVEGPLTDPDALAMLRQRITEVHELETDVLARGADGLVTAEGGVFSVLDATWESPAMASIVEERTGIRLTDADADAIPDTPEQLNALLAVASEIGVPLDATRSLLTPDEVRTAIVVTDGGAGRTSFELGLVNSRSQESVTQARMVLGPVAASISDDFDGSFVQVTGSPFVREASLEATNDALQTSLPVALVLCLIVATVFLRSIRYGLASVVPIIMVVAWLYAFMELAGYSINIVTATIAAVSVGIGIDFAIHFITRYREELERFGDRGRAVQAAGEGTGVALVASACSSAVGFGILAFAPMPLFAAYGLLTALMIVMALVATLAILPSILVVITSDRADDDLDETGYGSTTKRSSTTSRRSVVTARSSSTRNASASDSGAGRPSVGPMTTTVTTSSSMPTSKTP